MGMFMQSFQNAPRVSPSLQNRTILHIDFDSFFASCEQQFNPQFRGKPLGVTATNGRTCIIASSSQAKKLGIKTGSRTFEAFKLCPTLLLTPAHFTKYLEVSKKFLNICKDFSPLVEMFSIDEVFMDITSTTHLFGSPHQLIEQIKLRIKQEIGEYITASVGISHNKLLAKLASGMKKPNGMFTIQKEDVEQIYKTVELTQICGIGERIKNRLNAIGIFTLWQLGQSPLELLLEEFGDVEGHFLKQIGLGLDDSSVIPYTEATQVKSVGRNYCLPKNEYDQRVILQNVFELCEEIAIKLRRLNKNARTVGLSLRGTRSEHSRITGKTYIDSGKDIFKACKYLYDKWEWDKNSKENQMVRQISVWASNLEDVENTPLSLFDFVEKDNKVLKTVDAINEKFGDHTIRNGFLLYADKLTTQPNGYMADRFERNTIAKEGLKALTDIF